MKELLAIIGSLIFLIITGSAQGIIIPLLTLEYNSLYFILFIINFELAIVLSIIFAIMTFRNRKRKYAYESINYNARHVYNISKKSLLVLILAGLFSALMGVTKIYAANPKRTPPVMQSILAGLAILPSVIFTKFILKKNVGYKKKFIFPSLFFLLLSILIPIIDMKVEDDWTVYTFLWISLYTSGVIFRSLFNILQEKFFILEDDTSNQSKITAIFYTNIAQIIFILLLFWIELLIGDTEDYINDFFYSFYQMFCDLTAGLLLQAFIVAYLIFIGFSIYINSISTNYNMIVTIATTPAIALFFTIFSYLNPGVHFSWPIVIISLLCSIISIILWMLGENKYIDGYHQI